MPSLEPHGVPLSLSSQGLSAETEVGGEMMAKTTRGHRPGIRTGRAAPAVLPVGGCTDGGEVPWRVIRGFLEELVSEREDLRL